MNVKEYFDKNPVDLEERIVVVKKGGQILYDCIMKDFLYLLSISPTIRNLKVRRADVFRIKGIFIFGVRQGKWK